MHALIDTSALTLQQLATTRVAPIRILADDLTGACDAAAPFLAAGHSARVWLGPYATEIATESVQAFNTGSRDLKAPSAATAVSRAAKAFLSGPRAVLFKHVDSAGRGHFDVELLAAHRTLGTRAVLFAPSFPAAGRFVRNGVLIIRDATPVAYRALIMPFQYHAPTIHVRHAGQVRAALAGGARILICDASNQAELEAYAELDEPNLLYAGSEGLAYALAGFCPIPCAPRQTLPFAARILTISGTPHPAARNQSRHLAQGHHVLEIAAETSDAPKIVAHFTHNNPDALILTGSGTCSLVLCTLSATSILLRGELAPGLPWGIVQGGLAHNRIVIIQPSSSGPTETLTRILQSLQSPLTA